MTEHKFTDDEIIKALECCKSGYCIARKCPFYDATEDDDIGACTSRLSSNALDLINRQKAELERIHRHTEMYHEVRAEAIKEFAERLVAIYENDKRYDRPNAHTLVMTVFRNIDNLVKEMTVGKE